MFVVETYIDGREISVPVIDGTVLPSGRNSSAWAAGTIIIANMKVMLRNIVLLLWSLPANLNDVAAKACEACGAVGILRVDFRVDNTGQIYVLEINTIPGMSPRTVWFPSQFESTGMSLADFCDRRIQHPVSNSLSPGEGTRLT